jgi:hypothetical protein
MNVGIGTGAAQFLSWDYWFQIFGKVSLQCASTDAECTLYRRVCTVLYSIFTYYHFLNLCLDFVIVCCIST